MKHKKNIIEGTFYYIFAEIAKLSASDALKALKVITIKDVDPAEKTDFKNKGIWDTIKQAQKIFSAEHPETLLNLTSRNDKNTNVEADGVKDYIYDLIDQEKQKTFLLNRSAKHILFWYRDIRNKQKETPTIENQPKMMSPKL